ncbi:MAG TPA: hypothetical protein VFJ57_03005 [Solirubrobacterales bacterium]|nr:hypothetical protein [Solirubrobacterales bacterium]
MPQASREPPDRSIRLALIAAAAIAFAAAINPTATAAESNADCLTSSIPDGPVSLTAGLGPDLAPTIVIGQGEGSVLSGSLASAGTGVPGAYLCVYSRVLTDSEASFVGIAVSRPDGTYRFSLPPGPSRSLTVVARSSQGSQETSAVLKTQVRPSLVARPNPVHNMHFVRFSGRIPGPHGDKVTVVLRASAISGTQWFDFRHASTHDNGRFAIRYFFNRTPQATTYLIRAQVLGAPGYPYEAGNSRDLRLRVLP